MATRIAAVIIACDRGSSAVYQLNSPNPQKFRCDVYYYFHRPLGDTCARGRWRVGPLCLRDMFFRKLSHGIHVNNARCTADIADRSTTSGVDVEYIFIFAVSL